MKNVRRVLEISAEYQLGHIPSALSMLPILMALREERFTFFCGKPYGLQAYMTAWDINYLENTYCFDSNYYGWVGPSRNINFIYSDPNLGNAVSRAIAYVMAFDTPVVVLISDATFFMGETFEAMGMIQSRNLPVTVYVDGNGVQLFGEEKIDPAILSYIPPTINVRHTLGKCVVFNTKKGMGIPVMEAHPKDWHYRLISKNDIELLCLEETCVPN